MRKYFFYSLFCCIIFYVGCNVQSDNLQVKTSSQNSKVNNYFILKPIKDNIEYEWIENLNFKDTNVAGFINIIGSADHLKMDSSMKFTMSFEMQKKIIVNSNYLSKFIFPDSVDLVNIYFSSKFNTSNLRASNVVYDTSYKKNILNYGRAVVYEYHFEGVSQVSCHSMQIIIKSEENEYGEDYEGFVICSDGILWREISHTSKFLFSYLKALRGNIGIEIPMGFNGIEFIPLQHYKIDKWNKDVKD